MRFKKARRLAIQAVKVFLIAAMSAAARGWGQDSTNASPASSAPDPLLDLLIQKGILTQQEAERVEAEAAARSTNNAAQMPPMPASPWRIDKALKNIELFGDVRLRYENRSAEDPANGSINLQRLRYAVRLGLRGDLFDDFYYGVRLETSPNARSDFVTLGTSSSSTPYFGPFGKSNGGVNIGEVYLGWNPAPWVNVTVGKMPNPLYTTPMVWNSTITPEGVAEHFKYTVGQADFYATFGQFLYEDTNPNNYTAGYFNPLTTVSSGLPFLLAWQGGVNYHVTQSVNATVSPVLYQYTADNGGNTPAETGGIGPDFSGTFVGQGETFGVNGIPAYYNLANGTPGFDGFYSNQTGINDLLVLEIPFALDVKFQKMDLRLFGDYAQNLEGGQRAMAAYNAAHSTYFSASGPGQGLIQQIPSPQTKDVKAYQIGVGIGSDDIDYGPMQGLVFGTSSPRHSWEIRTYWQHIEQYSLDPNLLDWDFFNGLENLQGIYLAASYAFTGNLIGTFRYGHASRINHSLGTGGVSGDIPQINPVNDYDIYQVDLTFRF